MFFLEIAIDVPLRTTFTYKSETPVAVGARVIVPFRKQKRLGFCVASVPGLTGVTTSQGRHIETDKISVVSEVLDPDSFLPKQDWLWLVQAAEYYCAPLGQVLAQAIPALLWEVDAGERNKPRRARPVQIPAWKTQTQITLSADQKKIAHTILENKNRFYPVLLQGVTGSGKTEIYIEVIRQILASGQSVLYLVPEIGLTPQTLGRLAAHFPKNLLVYHSGLTDNQRYLQWQSCLQNQAQILVGTRSAVFAPFPDLGAIIIDEEHDSSYKQDDRFRYHARDLALMRAKIWQIPVVMGSATPSLEVYHQARQKKYHAFFLNDRFGGTELPRVDLIDIMHERNQTGSVLHLSQHIHRQIEQAVAAGQQAIVFMGHRGFAQNAFCVSCQKGVACPNCSVGLKFHKAKNELKCHYCDYAQDFDEVCPACHTKSLTLLGVGIQAVEKEIREMHPRLRFERVDSDRFSTPQEFADILTRFQKHEIDLILGTQMMTKGHDFAKVAFVAVAGVEAQLGLPDFRAEERAFQTIVQVAGRAGRDKKRGLVLVQTTLKEHDTLQMAIEQNFTAFAEAQLKQRQKLFFPPYSRLVQIRILARAESRLAAYLKTHHQIFMNLRAQLFPKQILMLGPTEMPIHKLRGVFRHHVILKMPKTVKTAAVVDYVLGELGREKPVGIEFQVDVDPLNMV